MTILNEVDVIVIGAGPAGEATAARLADAQLTVTLIEQELVGGECPYWGCMPSKALLRPAQARNEALRHAGVVVDAKLDIGAVLARRDEIVRGLDDTSHATRMTRRPSIELVRGSARFSAPRVVEVRSSDGATRTITATAAVVICTGSSAFVPPVPGLAECSPWTNREGTLATTAPHRLIVLGGGPIGVELAQAWATLGSRVTLVEGADRLLLREEPFASDHVADGLRATGVDLRLGVLATQASRGPDGCVTLTLDDGSAITADEIIVATGRTPNTATLNLEAAGIDTDPRGFLLTSNALRIRGSEWAYAVGDVTGRSAFTHTATYHAYIAAGHITGDHSHCVEDLIGAPRVTFCSPQVAAVGHTEQSALDAGLDVVIVDRDLSRLAASTFHGRGTPGNARAIFDRKSTHMIGATIVGEDVADLLHPATVAIIGTIPLNRLRHAVAPFPTRSEIWTAIARQADISICG